MVKIKCKIVVVLRQVVVTVDVLVENLKKTKVKMSYYVKFRHRK